MFSNKNTEEYKDFFKIKEWPFLLYIRLMNIEDTNKRNSFIYMIGL